MYNVPLQEESWGNKNKERSKHHNGRSYIKTYHCTVENNRKKNQRSNYIIKVGSTKDTTEQLTNISIFIKRESSVVVFLVDKSTLLAHTHHTLISLVFYKTPPLTKQQQQS